MLSIAHTLISLPFGVYLDQPIIIFLAAFVFHLFADTLLHWNIFPFQFKRYPYEWVALDVLGGLAVAYVIVGDEIGTIPILAAIIGGNAPDVLQGLWDMLPERIQNRAFAWAKPFFDMHDKLQYETLRAGRGIVWQLVLIVVAITLLP